MAELVEFDFERIQRTRDQLVETLVEWRRTADGLYASAPPILKEDGSWRENPSVSFTNTGIVLQGLIEAGARQESQTLAEILLRLRQQRDWIAFPPEKDKGDGEAHIFANSWVAFSVLDCLPARFKELLSLCDWFIQTQRVDGSWAFSESELSAPYPATTAYAVKALLQFLTCLGRDSSPISEHRISEIKKSIREAVNYLLEVRPKFAKNKALLLWQSTVVESSQPEFSFGTTAICIHVVAKAGRVLQRSDWEQMSINTLKDVAVAVANETHGISAQSVAVGSGKLKVWSSIHHNSNSSAHYFWAFFAPLSGVTILKFLAKDEVAQNQEMSRPLYSFVFELVEWVLENCECVDGRLGVKATENISGVKTWSTGCAVIVLSRVLDCRALLSRVWAGTSVSEQEKMCRSMVQRQKKQLSDEESTRADVVEIIQGWRDLEPTPKLKVIVVALVVVLSFPFGYTFAALHPYLKDYSLYFSLGISLISVPILYKIRQIMVKMQQLSDAPDTIERIASRVEAYERHSTASGGEETT